MTTNAIRATTTSTDAAAGRAVPALNRRAIMTVTAAAALSGTSAVAALARSDDPIYAVLRAYDPIARQFSVWFNGPFADLEGAEFQARNMHLEREARPRVQVGYRDALTVVQHKPDGDKVDRIEGFPSYVYDHEEIDSLCDRRAEEKAGDADALTRNEDDRTRWHDELTAAGTPQEPKAVHPVRAEMNRLCDLEHNARDALVTTQPITVAGAAALLRFLSRNGFHDDFVDDGDDAQQLVLTLAEALEKIASGSHA